MYDFSYPLGNAVKSTRYQRGLTQLQVADMADIDVRTVMNIENHFHPRATAGISSTSTASLDGRRV